MKPDNMTEETMAIQASRAKQALQRRIEACTERARPDKPPVRQFLLCRGALGDEGLIPKGGLGVLAADGGGGKTRLIMRLAGVLAAERATTPWVGDYRRRSPTPERVLVILGEEDRYEIARAQWRLARDFPGCLASIDWLSLVESGPMILATAEGPTPACATLAEIVRANGYGLVVVDHLVSFHACDENDNAQMQRVVEALGIVASSGGAVLACHHSSKGKDKWSADAARGASSLRDGARLLMTLSRVEQETSGGLQFKIAKSNYGATGETFRLHWEGDDFRPRSVARGMDVVVEKVSKRKRVVRGTNPNGLPRVGG